MKCKCVIIDDEPKALDLLVELIGELYPDMLILGAYLSWTDAKAQLLKPDFDVLFLDISMPQKSGIELLSDLGNVSFEVIFVTAYEEYALPAFRVGAGGYVLKPIEKSDLKNAVDRALERISGKVPLSQAIQKESPLPARISIPNGRGQEFVNVADIHYLESKSRYTSLVTHTGRLLSSYSIGKFEQLLEPYSFYRVHRCYIVNPESVVRYDGSGVIILRNGDKIPLSRSLKREFLREFNRRMNG